MFAGVTRTVTHVVMALAVAVEDLITAETVLCAHPITVLPNWVDASEQHQERSLLQSRGQVWVVSDTLIH